MSTPMVAGAAAVLLEANSNLTPNLVKMLLMYTAQPLANFNTLDQGARTKRCGRSNSCQIGYLQQWRSLRFG